LLALGASCALLTLLLIAYGLATARAPQHRAALEELIRHQTGLEVRFNSLAVRWGWYGPEALFQDVELGEPGSSTPLLRAQQLIVALDAWRMARSGHLEARRITLENPVIDLAGDGRGGPLAAAHTPAHERLAGTRILARWRGGQINLSGGTLRTRLPGTTDAVTVGISHAELRRLDTDWSADAQLLLPQTLGASLHVALQMRSSPDLSDIPSATLGFEGRHLQLAAWGALAGIGGRKELPRSGSGDIEIQAAFARGKLRSAAGRIAAEALEWPATAAAGSGLAFEHLRGKWQVEPRGTGWRLSVDGLELDSLAPTHSAIVADISEDGTQVRGEAQHAPATTLLSLERWYGAQPAGGLVLAGEARELSFDWDARRAPGTRLAASAELQSLALADDSGEIVLSGVSGNAAGSEASLSIALHARDALLAVRGASSPLDGLGIDASLNATVSAAGGWRVETHDLQIHRRGLSLSANGALGSGAAGSPVLIDTHIRLRDSEIALLANLLGPEALASCGEAAASLCDGRVEKAELSWRGPLAGQPLSASQIDWQATHFHALIDRARAGGFVLTDAVTDWDGHAAPTLRFRGHLAGDAGELIAWLQSHPQAAPWALGLQGLELQGNTALDLELAVPVARLTGTARQAPPPRVRVAALLDGAQLSPIAGVPALTALRGTLGFSGGHLQRSTLTARWLGGPASLNVSERREHGLPVLVVSGHGVMDAREAMQAAAVKGDPWGFSGSAEWTALLTVASGDGPARWQLHADSSLTGTASRLPEPFAKPAGTALPLHVDWEALDDAAQLHVALGERLAAVAALTRSGDTWRIERGAVRLGVATPALPVEPVMLLDGNMSRLDLAASIGLWRQAAHDAALPPLRARLSATELSVGTRHFPEVSVTAEAAAGGGALQVRSPDLVASARWAAVLDAGHPALLHLSRFNIVQSGDAAVAAELAGALAPAAQIAVDDLQWQGRSIGSFSGAFGVHDHALEASDLVLAGANAQTRGSAQCLESGCKLAFALDSADPAASLAAFGFAAELSAQQGHLEGQLRWEPQASAPLATLSGSLHMRLEDGIMSSTGAGAGMPFALLSVPALLAGIDPDAGDPAQPALRFARFSADYDLQNGQAVTPGLHFDGDAEILVRGRVGLSSGDYDQQAWILSGEERLPAAVRRLGPSPRVAAAWLSLRDMLGSERAARAHTALRLRGPWSDPIVTPVE
jgi:uncharacterized protein YhdP